MVTTLRERVHPGARQEWSALEGTLELALSEGFVKPQVSPPTEWAGAARWSRKLDKAWRKLDNIQGGVELTQSGRSEIDPS